MAETAFSLSALRRRGSSAAPSWLALPLAAVVALAALPLAYVAWEAAAVGWAGAAGLLFRPFTAGLLANTLELAGAVTLGALVVGTGAAWLVERSDLPGRAVWRVLMPLPLAMPALVSAFAWLSLTPRVEGMAGAVFVLVLAEYPLIYLPVSAALRGMDPALEDVALSVGHGPWRIFGRTVLPQLVPALSGGILLVTLHMLVEFGPLALLRVETFTTAIYEAYELSYDGAAAAMLSAVLIALCLAVMAGELALRGRRRFARGASGASAPRVPTRLGPARLPAAAALGAVVVLALGLPGAMLGYWLFLARRAPIAWDGIAAAVGDSVQLAGLGALVTTMAGLLLVLAAYRRRGRAAVLAERLPFLVHALPGLVVALSLVFFCLRVVPALYQTTALLMVAYAILFLPLAQTALRPAVEQVPPAMEEVALALGRAPWRVLLTVTLPNILPGLGAALLLVFMQLMKELTATLVLAPTGIRTLSMALWAQSSQMKYGTAAPYAALLVLVSGVPAYWATVQLQKRRERG